MRISVAAATTLLGVVLSANQANAYTRYCDASWEIRSASVGTRSFIFKFKGKGTDKSGIHKGKRKDRARHKAKEAIFDCAVAHWNTRGTRETPSTCLNDRVENYKYRDLSCGIWGKACQGFPIGGNFHGLKANLWIVTSGPENCKSQKLIGSTGKINCQDPKAIEHRKKCNWKR